MFRTLPALTVERTGEDKVGAHVASAVTEIVGLVDSAAPGTQALLGRLMELLFLGILRRHIAGLPAGSRGWFAALNDPVVGRALQLLHADPARRWTVDEIARRTGSSRTVLAGRLFKRLSAAALPLLACGMIYFGFTSGSRLTGRQPLFYNLSAQFIGNSSAVYGRFFSG